MEHIKKEKGWKENPNKEIKPEEWRKYFAKLLEGKDQKESTDKRKEETEEKQEEENSDGIDNGWRGG